MGVLLIEKRMAMLSNVPEQEKERHQKESCYNLSEVLGAQL